jgi:hypothetical protein
MTKHQDFRAVPRSPAGFADPIQPAIAQPSEEGEPPAVSFCSSTDLALPPDWVQLDWSKLTVFETVEEQFADRGVTFSNAIALQPSNPAYLVAEETTVLLAAPKSGWLEASFPQAVRYVSGCVTSSRRAVLSAFDANNQPLAQTETPSVNLAGTDVETLPHIELSLHAENIHRVTFQAFDGQLTLGEFRFSY